MTDILCYFIITFFIIGLVAFILELVDRHFGLDIWADFCVSLHVLTFRVVVLGIVALFILTVGGFLIEIISKVLR